MVPELLLVIVARYVHDFQKALVDVHFAVKVLQRLQEKFTWGTPLGREENTQEFSRFGIVDVALFGLKDCVLFPLVQGGLFLQEGGANELFNAGWLWINNHIFKIIT